MSTAQAAARPTISPGNEPAVQHGATDAMVTAVPLALQLMKPAPPAPAFAADFPAAITTLGSRSTAGDTEDTKWAGRLW